MKARNSKICKCGKAYKEENKAMLTLTIRKKLVKNDEGASVNSYRAFICPECGEKEYRKLKRWMKKSRKN